MCMQVIHTGLKYEKYAFMILVMNRVRREGSLTGLIWLRTGTDGLFWTRLWNFVFRKMRAISWLA